jgi:hypothetical protein
VTQERFGKLHGRGPAGHRRKYREFVAAEPSHQGVFADRFAQPLGNGAQQRVAHVVAQRIVNLLKMVEVDHQQGRRTALR